MGDSIKKTKKKNELRKDRTGWSLALPCFWHQGLEFRVPCPAGLGSFLFCSDGLANISGNLNGADTIPVVSREPHQSNCKTGQKWIPRKRPRSTPHGCRHFERKQLLAGSKQPAVRCVAKRWRWRMTSPPNGTNPTKKGSGFFIRGPLLLQVLDGFWGSILI